MPETNKEFIARCEKGLLEGDIRWQRYWFHESLRRLKQADSLIKEMGETIEILGGAVFKNRPQCIKLLQNTTPPPRNQPENG